MKKQPRTSASPSEFYLAVVVLQILSCLMGTPGQGLLNTYYILSPGLRSPSIVLGIVRQQLLTNKTFIYPSSPRLFQAREYSLLGSPVVPALRNRIATQLVIGEYPERHGAFFLSFVSRDRIYRQRSRPAPIPRRRRVRRHHLVIFSRNWLAMWSSTR